MVYGEKKKRKMVKYQFSMAPAAKSGMATRSIFGRGYGSAKYSVKNDRVLVATPRAKWPRADSPTGV